MAQGDLHIYDSDQYSSSLAGIPLLAGLADGEFMRVARDTAAFDDVVGTSGEVTRSKTNDDRGTVTLRLMQTSPVNDLLSVLHNSDKNTPGGVGVGSFMLRDRQGTTLIAAEKAWISMEPEGSWDRTANEREWTIRLAKQVAHHGGTATV